MNPEHEKPSDEAPAPSARRKGFFWTRPHAEPSTHYLVRWLFLRALALVYLVAFLSYWTQVDGLIGHNGILPADGMALRLAELIGPQRFWKLPSLFWLYPHDLTLHLLCGGGVVMALALLVGLVPPVCLLTLWVFYLSLVTVSQDFLSFQWDALLLETGFMAVFLGPFRILPRLSKEAAPSPVVVWLLRWLLFRLMFGSGFVKLGDETWRTLSALFYHFETQPLPTPLAWYANQLPGWFLEFSVLASLVVELVAPFLIFGTRRMRLGAFFLLAFLQVLIMLTGNFAFFNWLSLALCILLLDDQYVRRILPARLARLAQCPTASPAQRRYRRIAAATLASLLVLLGAVQLVRSADRKFQTQGPLAPVLQALEPFRLINPYGLFAVMTTARPEIVVEGSVDGEKWIPYEFKWKPGDPRRAPGWVAPHQPRLDWQMWFAALGPPGQTPWFQNFIVRLLQGSPEVVGLLAHNPFPNEPPRYIRATLYQYAFSRFEDGKSPQEWWVREEMAPYFPRISLR